MENEIKVNDYVRTTQGYIAKVEDMDDDFIHCDETIYFDGYDYMSLLPIKEIDYIVKHSKNIIDLIEVGDYVNGEEVIIVTKSYIQTAVWDLIEFDDGKKDLNIHTYTEEKIKTIVTKEKMKSISYKVKE